ncbi:hypothetical protein ACFQ1I_40965 [Kitasatospora arboriphila]
MALELPPELAAVLDLLGLHWPRVNEDELDRLADGLRGVASQIDSVQMVADKALTALGEVYHGTSADRLAELWRTVSTYSGLVVEACGAAANALNAAALGIEACKSATVVQLVATQGELAVSSLLGPADSAAVLAAYGRSSPPSWRTRCRRSGRRWPSRWRTSWRPWSSSWCPVTGRGRAAPSGPGSGWTWPGWRPARSNCGVTRTTSTPTAVPSGGSSRAWTWAIPGTRSAGWWSPPPSRSPRPSEWRCSGGCSARSGAPPTGWTR